MRGDMWDGLDAVTWRQLRHNYGRATDLPPLLRACADPDADVATRSLDELHNKVHHQGGWVCPAAAASPSCCGWPRIGRFT